MLDPKKAFEKLAGTGKLFAGSNYIVMQNHSVWKCTMWVMGGIADIIEYKKSDPSWPTYYYAAVTRQDTLFEAWSG